MRKPTVAEMRQKQLERFNNNYIHNYQEAKRILNIYYRYVALAERVLILENDSQTYNTRYCKEESANEERRRKALQEILKPYNIIIYVPWTLPFLGIKDDKTGAIKENVIDPILY